jgi:hypothetical protein
MNRNVLFALAIIATPALASCSGSTPPPQETEIVTPTSMPSTVSTDSTVAIDNNQWTCKDIVDTSSEHCNPLMQRVFDDYGWNLYRFINEGELNELKAQKVITPDKIAYVGLVACATMTGPPNYEDYFLAFEHDERFKTLSDPKPALADAWSEAEKLLCFTKEEANS